MNHVSQPTAALLQAAGWVDETDMYYQTFLRSDGRWYLTDTPITKGVNMPAPNIQELRFHPDGRERLTYEDLFNFWHSNLTAFANEWAFASWLFTVLGDAEEIAKVWLWKNGKEVKP